VRNYISVVINICTHAEIKTQKTSIGSKKKMKKYHFYTYNNQLNNRMIRRASYYHNTLYPKW